MSEQRPYKLVVKMTDKEFRLVREYAEKHKMPRQSIMIQALRLYDMIESGRAMLAPTTPPVPKIMKAKFAA